MKKSNNTLLTDIREVNLSYLLLMQRMLRDNYANSIFQLGFNEQVADVLLSLSSAQLIRLATSSSLLCRFHSDNSSLLSSLSRDMYDGTGLAQVQHISPVAIASMEANS